MRACEKIRRRFEPRAANGEITEQARERCVRRVLVPARRRSVSGQSQRLSPLNF